MNLNPTIDQYLLSTCLFIIDEFNGLYQNLPKSEIKKIADEKYNEMDICVRIGYPFRQMAHYTVGDSKRQDKSKVNHDIYIEPKDFKIEVKYLKNWKSASQTNSASKNWDKYQADFDWLLHETRSGNKGKRAFIIGWFNCVDRFSQLIQLGEGAGNKPKASEKKHCYFPFLTKMNVPALTTDLVYNYNHAYKPLPVNLIGDVKEGYNCLFLGNEHDVFHFAIYY
ncbi:MULTISPECIES: hypothetical protein [unclassified Dehalobacter]|uniref:hypothetical protein n=1 Tax=unclassified Dehalobacter TaxID=2635733 RepID=UPI000E6C5B87|nr:MULTISPECIES: hypothetical protein [unclassified Dehalobacter]RJE48914.1 hypothetical protein A7K50_09230 [Dehalobacter sp. MCB1]TCX52078.1 hypothetical protein C1I36_07115 [Dehalobacter sp. 14DCB1]TCX53151.1 hypothetical protein C1I38_08880 [Dehalobacter sp. 12DCB1]